MDKESNQLYSKTSAANILSVKPEDISQLEVWENCIFVKIKGTGGRMISMKKFKKSFVESRKSRSTELEVIPVPLCGSFVVKNSKRNTQYLVYLIGDSRGNKYSRIECGCQDFSRQIKNNPEFLGSEYACCKLIYAVLNHIGYSNLRDFIKK